MDFWVVLRSRRWKLPSKSEWKRILVPPKAELKGENFAVELNDLKVAMTVDIASKEIVETPNLRGNIKITNKSKDIIDIQAVVLPQLEKECSAV